MPVKISSARYGWRIRKRFEKVKLMQKTTYVCPKCGVKAVRNVRLGIWRCRKCGVVFTGAAWRP